MRTQKRANNQTRGTRNKTNDINTIILWNETQYKEYCNCVILQIAVCGAGRQFGELPESESSAVARCAHSLARACQQEHQLPTRPQLFNTTMQSVHSSSSAHTRLPAHPLHAAPARLTTPMPRLSLTPSMDRDHALRTLHLPGPTACAVGRRPVPTSASTRAHHLCRGQVPCLYGYTE